MEQVHIYTMAQQHPTEGSRWNRFIYTPWHSSTQLKPADGTGSYVYMAQQHPTEGSQWIRQQYIITVCIWTLSPESNLKNNIFDTICFAQ